MDDNGAGAVPDTTIYRKIKILLDKRKKQCYYVHNDKTTYQLQLSIDLFEFPVCVIRMEALEKLR